MKRKHSLSFNLLILILALLLLRKRVIKLSLHLMPFSALILFSQMYMMVALDQYLTQSLRGSMGPYLLTDKLEQVKLIQWLEITEIRITKELFHELWNKFLMLKLKIKRNTHMT